MRDQQESIKTYAQANGLTVTQYYVEAESGIREKEEKREQMTALLKDVKAGDLVLCDKLDRWSRDPEFTYSSVRKILEAGARFYAVSDRCDPSTPEGDTALGFRVLFAREEHKRIKERMVGTRHILRTQGYYVEGIPPLGYRRTLPKGSKGLEKNILVVVPEEALLVKQIFALYVGGDSMGKVAERLALHIDRVKDALSRRLYTGQIQVPASRRGAKDGHWIKGKHEAIIDEGLYLRAQELRSRRRRGGACDRPCETSDWILRDVARCAQCSGKMGAAYGGTPEARRYYYACSKGCRPMVRVDAAEAAFAPLVLARLKELRTLLVKPVKPKAVPQNDNHLALEKIKRKRERYLEAFANELMTRLELKVAMAKLDSERLRLAADEPSNTNAEGLTPEEQKKILEVVESMARAWEHLMVSDRSGARSLVRLLADSVSLAKDAEPFPSWRPLRETPFMRRRFRD